MWVLFSERADQFSRLVSLNLENGKQTCIATASAGIPIIAAYEASARRLAYIHDAGGDANVVWYRLPSLEPERFGGLWNGRPVRIALSLCGRRAALESILPTGVTAIYVFELPEISGAAELMAGITLGEGVSLKRPLFLDGRDRIFCFVQGEGGGVSTALIDLSHIGEATHTAPGARRAARIRLVKPEISLIPDGPCVDDSERGSIIVTGVETSSSGQQLYRLFIGDGAVEPIGRPHTQVNALGAVPGGKGVVYAADSRVWQTSDEGADSLVRLPDGLRTTSLIRDVPGGRYVYGFNRGMGINISTTSVGREEPVGWRVEGGKLMALVGVLHDADVLPFDELAILDPAVRYMPGSHTGGHDRTEPLPTDRALLAPTGQLTASTPSGVRLALDQTMASGEAGDEPMFASQGDLTETEAVDHDAFTTLKSTGELGHTKEQAPGPTGTPQPDEDGGTEAESTHSLGSTESVSVHNMPDEVPESLSETHAVDPILPSQEAGDLPEAVAGQEQSWETQKPPVDGSDVSDDPSTDDPSTDDPSTDDPSTEDARWPVEPSPSTQPVDSLKLTGTGSSTDAVGAEATNIDADRGDSADDEPVAQPDVDLTLEVRTAQLDASDSNTDHADRHVATEDSRMPGREQEAGDDMTESVSDEDATSPTDVGGGLGAVDDESVPKASDGEGEPATSAGLETPTSSASHATIDEDDGYGDESDDVWTSAPSAAAPPFSEPAPVRNVVSSARERLPRKVAESDAPRAQLPPADTGGPRPDVDFDVWFDHMLTMDDPVPHLASLERFSGDRAIGIAVEARLQRQVERLEQDPDTLSDLIFIMAAAAHVRAQAARERLLKFCTDAYERVSRGGRLPEVEEHFAMAVVRALDNPAGRFSTMAVYREYEGVVTAMSDALENGGEESAARRLGKLGRRYRRALEKIVYPDQTPSTREQRKPKRPRATPSAGTQPVSAKIDLMEGYEFPAMEDPVQEAGEFVDKFQPFMSVFSTTQSGPIADRPSVEAFRVTAFDEVGDEFPEWTPPETSNTLAVFLGLAAITGGLALAILGYRLTGLHALVGVLWTVGGIALVGGRAQGITLGGVSYGLASLLLLYTGFVMDLPAWILPEGVAAGGVLTLVVTVFILTRLRGGSASTPFDTGHLN